VDRAALVRTARKIFQGELHIPAYVFSNPSNGDKPMKRLVAPALAAALAAATPIAMAAYPTKTITIVVPTAAGGGNDGMARTIAQKLGPILKQTVIIDNRAGGNGAIASEFVANAPCRRPRPHVRLHRHPRDEPRPAEASLRSGRGLRADRPGGYSPTLMVVNRDAPVKDVKDLVSQLKAKPDKYALRLGREPAPRRTTPRSSSSSTRASS
jgi:hypothetical protein